MSSSGATSEGRTSLLGIIGGSGLCSFPELPILGRVRPQTVYGLPSDDLVVSEIGGYAVVFLPRHGSKHSIPPHKVPYKANLVAMRDLGVTHVVATCIAGSLKQEIQPGDLVVPDQFVNLTWGRDDSFGQDGEFLHLPMSEPYCVKMRKMVLGVAQSRGYRVHPKGTVAVVQGPRFSTRAESEWYIRNGWDLVNMTQYPECYFARELGLCYSVCAAITDYDVGVPSSLSMDPSNLDRVLGIFQENIRRTKDLLLNLPSALAGGWECGCARGCIREYFKTS